jgi:hypothetical protein
MFHMLSCFDLGKSETVEQFQVALSAFSEHMKSHDLVQSTSPIGRRCSNTPMDTDSERDYEYYFVTTFIDREQCDKSYEYIEAGSPIHASVISRVKDAVFICWEDIEQ